MAPSRGLTAALRTRKPISRSIILAGRRSFNDFAQSVTRPRNTHQVYVSRSLDPYVNLSLEHFLLQKTPAESTILFLYTNRPCIVLGRNQNPWLEVNLGLLRSRGSKEESLGETNTVGDVHLVRRRSGGGTVFHDEGNVNYSVICPTSAFDRDRHAKMVVRALKSLGVDRAMVNERHDIVLRKENSNSLYPEGEQATGDGSASTKPFKISGSAYKLTRLRSLHHGTCLLSSPNLKHISQYLHSPAKPYIKARGVDSVSSPVANVNVPNYAFEDAVIDQFRKMYDAGDATIIGDEEAKVPDVAKGLTELRVSHKAVIESATLTYGGSLLSGPICRLHSSPSPATSLKTMHVIDQLLQPTFQKM